MDLALIINNDKNKIQQVISNFISNAIKYSPRNSLIKLKLEIENQSIIFSCQDQGYGIAEDEQNLIFEPFKKAQSSQYINEQSTGLGLAISKEIITGHEGEIWLESQIDQGSTFYFSLPYKQ